MSHRKLSALEDLDAESLELVRRALTGLRYGECVIAIHDGEIVQVSRTERLRPQRQRPEGRNHDS